MSDFSIFVQTFEDLKFLVSLLAPFKWFIFPALAFFAFLVLKNTLLFYSQSKFKQAIEWDIFEIRIPREVEKGPKAMDQFFTSLWTLFNIPSNWKEKYVDGELTRWYSFEIVGWGGTVHFYIRTPKKFRHTVESMLYAEYPEIEISDAQDYVSEFSSYDRLKASGYDLFGVELKLKNAAPYPINTYVNFEEKGGEERIIDPISVILELLSKLRPEEKAWIQMVIRPAHPGWAKEAEKVMKEIREKAVMKPPARPGIQQPAITLSLLTPAEEESLKAVARKVSKRGFEILIRNMYLAPKDIFDKNMWKNLVGYFNQYSSHLNYFAFNLNSITSAKWYKWPFIFPDRRTESKKRKFLYRYSQRYIPEETFIGRFSDPNRIDLNQKSSVSILNSEELATLYHPPTNVVLTAPTLDRIESKKVSPPGYIPF